MPLLDAPFSPSRSVALTADTSATALSGWDMGGRDTSDEVEPVTLFRFLPLLLLLLLPFDSAETGLTDRQTDTQTDRWTENSRRSTHVRRKMNSMITLDSQNSSGYCGIGDQSQSQSPPSLPLPLSAARSLANCI